MARRLPRPETIEGIAEMCPRVKDWVIRLDDGSGLSELGYASFLMRNEGCRIRLSAEKPSKKAKKRHGS